MSGTSVDDRIQFIKTSHIAPSQGSATVAGGSFVSFVGNLPSQQKASRMAVLWLVLCVLLTPTSCSQADVVNSTLFAQLVANKQHDRQNDSKAWYDSYQGVLESLGWTVPSFEYVCIASSSR